MTAARGGVVRDLALNDQVYADDKVTTGANSSVAIVLDHNGAKWLLGADQSHVVSEAGAFRAPKGTSDGESGGDESAAAGRHAEREGFDTSATVTSDTSARAAAETEKKSDGPSSGPADKVAPPPPPPPPPPAPAVAPRPAAAPPAVKRAGPKSTGIGGESPKGLPEPTASGYGAGTAGGATQNRTRGGGGEAEANTATGADGAEPASDAEVPPVTGSQTAALWSAVSKVVTGPDAASMKTMHQALASRAVNFARCASSSSTAQSPLQAKVRLTVVAGKISAAALAIDGAPSIKTCVAGIVAGAAVSGVKDGSVFTVVLTLAVVEGAK